MRTANSCKIPLRLAVVALFGTFLASCSDRPDRNEARRADMPQEPATIESASRAADEPITAGRPGANRTEMPATTGASVWEHIRAKDYTVKWAMWPGRDELYEGQEPHGMLLTTYVNDIALAGINDKSGNLAEGSIIVKENYTPDEELAAITVMYKVAGFNTDHHDWFFAKFLPNGTLDAAPDGTAMEGTVAACQACHSTKKDNDYIFTGPVTNATEEE
jgi:hypothetical protein